MATEYLLSIDDFNKPKVLPEKDSTYILIVRLILTEPGLFQSRPDMGVGLISRYRYSDTVDLDKLKTDIRNQMQKYLPNFITNEINLSENNKILTIEITVNSVLYKITLDKQTKTIQDL